jgi:hypothetical protein
MPGSLFVSILRNDDPNIKEFLLIDAPRTGPRTSLDLEFRAVGTELLQDELVEPVLRRT